MFITEVTRSSSEDNVDGLGSIQKIWQGQRHRCHIYDGNAIDVQCEEVFGSARRSTT